MKLINTLTGLTWIAIMLVACGGIGGDPLNGTTWELYSIGSHAPISGSKTTLRFEAGQVSGLGGCNQYGGEYQINGDTLSIDKLYATEMACMSPAGVMAQEQDLLKALGDAQRFELGEGQLQITGPEGEALTFVPAR